MTEHLYHLLSNSVVLSESSATRCREVLVSALLNLLCNQAFICMVLAVCSQLVVCTHR